MTVQKENIKKLSCYVGRSARLINFRGTLCWHKSLCKFGSSVDTSACPGKGFSPEPPDSTPSTDLLYTYMSVPLLKRIQKQDKPFQKISYYALLKLIYINLYGPGSVNLVTKNEMFTLLNLLKNNTTQTSIVFLIGYR